MFEECSYLRTVGIVIGSVHAFLITIGAIAIIVAWTHGDTGTNDNEPHVRTARDILYTTIMLFVIVHFLAAVLLVVGSVNEWPKLLILWLVILGISLILQSISLLFMLISAMVTCGLVMLGGFLGNAASFAIEFIIWLAVYTLYGQLEAKSSAYP